MAVIEFNQFGHPGNLKTATIVNGGSSLHCTGSMYGCGAVMTTSGYNGIVYLSDGGFVSGSHLTAGVVYNLSVLEIGGGSAGSIYVFKTQKVS